MAKVRCKGTVLHQEIASVFTAVAQVVSMSHSGGASEDYDATTLDTSGAGKEYELTGYSDGGNWDFDLFYDPALAGHQAITDLVTTPAKQKWKVIYADTGTTEEPFTSAGITVGREVAMSDGLKMSVSCHCTGLPTFST